MIAFGASDTDRIIVRYRDQAAARKTTAGARVASRRVTDAAHQRGLNASPLRTDGRGAQVWAVDRKMTYEEALALTKQIAAADPEVEYAEPDLIMRPTLVPNDPYYPFQPDLHPITPGINAPAAWDRTSGTGVVVAVADTGYRPHADLAANLLGGYDFVSLWPFGASVFPNDGDGRDSDARDPGDWCVSDPNHQTSSWHGTHVAGTIGAVTNNGVGVAGIAHGARILPVRVLGMCGGYSSDIADGISWAAGLPISGVPNNVTPARVINLSLGGPGSCLYTYANAISAARSKGAVVVVSAGNSNGDAANAMPANCPGVVAVASVNASGTRSSFSNYGPTVALAAPGETILSTYNTGTTTPVGDAYAYSSGTSMSAPHVAGVAALMLSANPSLAVDAVTSLLRSSSRAFPGDCTGCGIGLVDAGAAVNAAIAYGAANRIDESTFFVQQLYFDVLRRKPDSGGLAFYMGLLNACNGNPACLASTRVNIALGLFQSQESQALYPDLNPATSPNYNDAFVTRIYQCFLQRNFDPDGGVTWYSYLNGTNDYAGVMTAFITSPEYRKRFGNP
ncbi:S8 family serine peptidase [Corallococcus aberystwythensis]|uniref:S8 family serine peptidase n=1 Tax=Corallococcus aberystwythensis TaxID=2316722 RepID=UPI001ABF947C|nr:S8 family serine peptidase [Corallococcus aberystwythensis]